MDIRVFGTLVRFDAVYVVYFKTNKTTIQDTMLQSGVRAHSPEMAAHFHAACFCFVASLHSRTVCLLLEDGYKNLFEYMKDVFQTPGISKSVNMRHIKA